MTAQSSPASSEHLVPSRIAPGHAVLALVLGGRAVTNAGFAFWLWSVEPDRRSFFAGAATYLAVDGVCALLATAILAFGAIDEAPRALVAATAADGLLRICAAITLRVFPGLTDFPVTAVGFFGIIGSCTVCLAVAAITIRFAAARSRHRAHERMSVAVHEELDPLLLAGIVALGLVAYAFFSGPPVTVADYRTMGIRWAAALAGAFLIAALGVLTARARTGHFDHVA